MKTRFLSVIIFSITLISPSQVYAGEEEWADAGKIMAGLYGIRLIQQIARAHHTHVRKQVIVRELPARIIIKKVPAPGIAGDKTEAAVLPHILDYKIDPKKESAKFEKENTSKITISEAIIILTDKKLPNGNTVKIIRKDSTKELIIDLGDGQRIYQSKKKGSKAILQIYSQLEKRWVNIKTYPSLIKK